MKRLTRIALIIALVGTLALLALPGITQAQGSFSYTFDFTHNDGGFTSISGDHSTWSSAGWAAGCSDNGFTVVRIRLNVAGATSFTSGTAVFDATLGTGSFGSNSWAQAIQVWNGGSFVVNMALADGLSGTNQTLTGSTGGSGDTIQLELRAGQTTAGSCPGGSLLLKSITFTGTGSSPFPTQTPTPSPTPTSIPTGPLPALTNYDPCPLMGDTNANLSDTSRWNLHAGAHQAIPNGIDFGTNTGGAPASTGYASQIVTLSRYNKYIVTLKYKQTTSAVDQSFLFELGNTPALTVGLATGTAEQNVTFPAANYEPSDLGSADQFQILLASGSVDPGNDIIVTYICIADENATGPGTNAKALATQCKACTYEPGTIHGLGDIINNIVMLLQWLWCGFSQIWDCSVRPFFAALLEIIAIIISAIAFIRQWVGIILTNGNAWIGTVLPILAHWVAGFIINVIQALLNAAATLAQSLGLGGLLSFISTLFSNIPAILGLISSWVQTAIQQVISVLAAIPTLFISLVNGFNHASESTGAVAPVCNNTASPLYGPCLGLYVLDNTIFSGPIFYVVPLALGLVAFNTVVWALGQIRGALSK